MDEKAEGASDTAINVINTDEGFDNVGEGFGWNQLTVSVNRI